ncbi:MAG: UDP-N-acetylglucosamine pyrophosphorylase [Deltaproteobacteria bacterium]|nr:UDP-N-acetylglucosamine pyrophosphorylase [Deltaproteobacteria bacterium]
MKDGKIADAVVRLMEKGVKVPNPYAVEIGDDVDIDRISGEGTVLYSGTKLYGSRTMISSGTKLGHEAPVTVVNCQLGPSVELKGGYFKESTFLEKANMAFGAQVREGCILEEEANGSHTVGLKQTILFPFVTLGSLINFCDCFMAGGTSRKNHSEVGSSYIHFNYTPNQDKATASLIGDVPRGVMLDQPPIFLGGQGGMVGPVRIGYGTVIAAGTVYRDDCVDGGKLLGSADREMEKDFHPGWYGDVRRRVYNNICYLANLLALKEWYAHVRRPFFESSGSGAALYEGAVEKLDMALGERLKRFEAFSEKMARSIEIGKTTLAGSTKESVLKQQEELCSRWSELLECFTGEHEKNAEFDMMDAFLRVMKMKRAEKGDDYIAIIQTLNREEKAAGTAWLQAVVDDVVGRAITVVPSFAR